MNSKLDEVTEELERTIEKQKRLSILTIMPTGIVGLIMIFLAINLDKSFFTNELFPSRSLLATFGSFFIFVSISASVATYLRNGFKWQLELENSITKAYKDHPSTSEIYSNTSEFRTEINNLLSDANIKIHEYRESLLDQNLKESLIEDIRTEIVTQGADGVLEDVKYMLHQELEDTIGDEETYSKFDNMGMRIEQEIEALKLRGNTNLALGAATTIIGLLVLGYMVLSQNTYPKTIHEFLYIFVPRLTLVVVIELFAFFFLSLYKNSLQEIKYFQNEITNIESKHVALKAAIDHKDKVMLSTILGKLVDTERNSILNKDQTTVELERFKLEKTENTNLMKLVTDILSKKT